jgi:hypothetical protein
LGIDVGVDDLRCVGQCRPHRRQAGAKIQGSDVLDAGLLIPKRLHQNIFGRTKT